MKTNLREQQKEVAIKVMQTMNLYKPYINAFKDSNTITLYESHIGFYIDENEEILSKIQEVEEEYDCLVYAVTHEYTSFGECYDLLIVPENQEEWDEVISYSNRTEHVVFAYVVNKDDPWCSEFGDITVKQFGGGLARVA